jgi:Reverse transcriptase (RNA-dependent DNA polymerase).
LKTNPDLYKGFSLDGIPDQFRPGDWRESDIMDRIKGIKDSTREAFGKLLDKHTNLLSFYPTDGRPIIIDGKPVEIDIKLSTDKPIFLKPYPVVGKMVEVLDAKLDELISRQEIRPVESKYNMPILLTHHNSQNKHVDIADKKFRLVIDNRVINSVMEDKNLYSFLVKGVDHLFTRLQGAEWISTLDCVRAYRSLTASHFTQMATAFRTPSSLKYPHVTWAFRSTPDGLANLPGEYSRCIQLALSPKSKACTAAHIDDILVFSPTEERHLEDLDSVFTDLLKCNFLISMKKFEPFQKEVQFLGHIINGKEIWIPEQRKSYFDLLEPPNTKKGLQSLLGICNYMSTFVESYAMKVGPLYDLLKGKTEKERLPWMKSR